MPYFDLLYPLLYSRWDFRPGINIDESGIPSYNICVCNIYFSLIDGKFN